MVSKREIFTVRGLLALEGTMIDEFIQRASASAIGAALTSLGNALAAEAEAIPAATIARCERLYDFVLLRIVERRSGLVGAQFWSPNSYPTIQ
jgi:hypothetical protein